MASFGQDYSPSALRVDMAAALAVVPGISPSRTILDLDNLPDSIKDRSYTLILSASSDRGSVYPDTTVTQYTCVLTYAKLLNPLGNEDLSLQDAMYDMDNVFRALMSLETLKTAEIAQEEQSTPVYHRGGSDGQYLLIQQTYTVIARRPHTLT